MRPLQILVALILFVGCSGPAEAQSACPQSCFDVSWHHGFCVTAARIDTTSSGGSCGNEVGFDIPDGTLFCATVGGFGNCWGGTDVADDFAVAGAPSGTTVNLRVQLAINTSSFGGASATGSIWRDSESLATWSHVWADTDPFSEEDTTLSAFLPVTAGVPFRLHFKLAGSAGGDAIRVVSQGSFSFDGLAPGQRIESCQGFEPAHLASA